MIHPALTKMIEEAKKEHEAMWAVAKEAAKREKRGLYKSYAEAVKNNPGYSSDYFWKDNDGYWRCF